MKTIEGLLIEDKLGRFISNGYYKIAVEGFENFTAEAHLYALLEWSRFPRATYSEKERLEYLYQKCWLYTKPEKSVEFEIIDTPFGYAVELKKDNALPF
jgi:hypothetical protein